MSKITDYLPHFTPPVAFEPISDDNDELIRAIQDDPVVQDDRWTLDEAPDEARLEHFWDEVLSEFGTENPEASEETATK